MSVAGYTIIMSQNKFAKKTLKLKFYAQNINNSSLYVCIVNIIIVISHHKRKCHLENAQRARREKLLRESRNMGDNMFDNPLHRSSTFLHQKKRRAISLFVTMVVLPRVVHQEETRLS